MGVEGWGVHDFFTVDELTLFVRLDFTPELLAKLSFLLQRL